VIDWWQATPALWAEASADGDDFHANRAETSLMLALAPDLVRRERARDADDVDRTSGLAFRYTAAALSRNGVTGRPSEASDELGRRLLEMATSAIVERIQRAREEDPPLGQAPPPTSLLLDQRSLGAIPPA
jgi:creatinine amidohydrolase